MLLKNAIQKIHVYAYDSTTGVAKTGDAANITAYVSLDGTANAIDDTNPAEVDATNMPGVYVFDLTAAETNCDSFALYAKSATSNIRIEPIIGFTTAGTSASLSASLADGAHGGSSAVLTLSSIVVNNPSGTGVAITGTTIGLDINASAGQAVDIDGTTRGVAINASNTSVGVGLSIYGGYDGVYIDKLVNEAFVVSGNIQLIGQFSANSGIVGSITGNLSGSVGSVTGAVGSIAYGGIAATSFAAGAITAAAIATDAIDADAIKADALTEIKTAMEAAGGHLALILEDTNEVQAELADGGRTDLLIDGIAAKTINIPASPAAVGSAMTVSDKTGFSLAATGLDAITATEPTGKPSTFPGWIMWLIQNFRKASKTPTVKKVETEAGVTITTQAITDDGAGTETLGPPS